jgi:hypothetical protein
MALDQQTALGPDADLVKVIGTAVRDRDFGAVAGVLRDALPHTRTVNLVQPAPGCTCGIGLHDDLHSNDAGHQPKAFR